MGSQAAPRRAASPVCRARAHADNPCTSLVLPDTRLNKEVRDGSGPILPRLQKVLAYVQEEALPALKKAAVEGKGSGVDGTPSAAGAK